MKKKDLGYSSEDHLVQLLCDKLQSSSSPWGEITLAREFGYVRGRTDVIALDNTGSVLAFEVKLHDWKKGLHQAYRNTCFAHCSYVVLPEESARRANQHVHEFSRRSVGLCTVGGARIDILVHAKHQSPIQPWLSRQAVMTVEATERK